MQGSRTKGIFGQEIRCGEANLTEFVFKDLQSFFILKSGFCVRIFVQFCGLIGLLYDTAAPESLLDVLLTS